MGRWWVWGSVGPSTDPSGIPRDVGRDGRVPPTPNAKHPSYEKRRFPYHSYLTLFVFVSRVYESFMCTELLLVVVHLPHKYFATVRDFASGITDAFWPGNPVFIRQRRIVWLRFCFHLLLHWIFILYVKCFRRSTYYLARDISLLFWVATFMRDLCFVLPRRLPSFVFCPACGPFAHDVFESCGLVICKELLQDICQLSPTVITNDCRWWPSMSHRACCGHQGPIIYLIFGGFNPHELLEKFHCTAVCDPVGCSSSGTLQRNARFSSFLFRKLLGSDNVLTTGGWNQEILQVTPASSFNSYLGGVIVIHPPDSPQMPSLSLAVHS